MKAEFVNPFLNSILDVLSTMAQIQATPGKPYVKSERASMGDVSGLIGLAGNQMKGSLAISFTEPVIFQVAKNMLGEEVNTVDDIVTDLVGEITNIVTGGAKRTLSEMGYDFDLAIPGVIAGKNHIITHMTKGQTIVLPFHTEQGDFFVEICFEE
ncbi:MAG: chemotaxis protein CheX [Sedimenticola sp.]|nr:chemotaxis protein CheX [Sedimenticola sp.]MCW8882831.1 chemotaxis protein CheX [Sedimenticola sp.]MCW8948218.1 chemotaxis protein CheX [Sedimenticola sp.]MCW8948736.1 chemotaxis protein CheX [Sedimenticola sp.]MCW8976059.1 chemotaxis protein CheX [Sedimenticola sp.]